MASELAFLPRERSRASRPGSHGKCLLICIQESELAIIRSITFSYARVSSGAYRVTGLSKMGGLPEATNGLVSKTPKLNEEYVQQRLLTNSNLYDTGFSVIDGELATSNDSDFARDILADIARVRTNDLSSARKNPGKLKDALAELNPDRYSFLEPFNPNKQITFLTGPKAVGSESESTSQETRKQPRKRPAKHVAQKLFGGTLQPRGERSNEIYRAIDDIYLRYSKDKAGRQYYLPIIAFSLKRVQGSILPCTNRKLTIKTMPLRPSSNFQRNRWLKLTSSKRKLR